MVSIRQILKKSKIRWSGWTKRIILLTCTGVIGIAGAAEAAGKPSFCIKCHEMMPEYQTWQASAHNRLECIVCHRDQSYLRSLQPKHLKNDYLLPLELESPIPDSICEACHTQARTITPSGDIIVPHDKHLAQGVTCVRCHAGVAHGQITERQITIDGDFERWNTVAGRANMAWPYRTVGMSECLECHQERDAPLDCKACHQRIVEQETHQAEGWLMQKEHGQAAFQNVNECDKCHSNTVSLTAVPLTDPVAAYARGNTLCLNCHRQKPPSHNEVWSKAHGVQAQADKRGCLVCHQERSASKSDKAAATVCLSCHGKRHSLPPTHGIPLTKDSEVTESCYNCHVKKVCTQCHR